MRRSVALSKSRSAPTSLGTTRYLNDDRIGKDGLESSYEQELHGQLGMEAILVNALNQPVRAPEVVQAALRRATISILTIDIGFQQQVEQILPGTGSRWCETAPPAAKSRAFAYKRDYKPIRSGVAIVTEVRTGRVLAMVSWPAYDNNLWDPPTPRPGSASFTPATRRPSRS